MSRHGGGGEKEGGRREEGGGREGKEEEEGGGGWWESRMNINIQSMSGTEPCYKAVYCKYMQTLAAAWRSTQAHADTCSCLAQHTSACRHLQLPGAAHKCMQTLAAAWRSTQVHADTCSCLAQHTSKAHELHSHHASHNNHTLPTYITTTFCLKIFQGVLPCSSPTDKN